MNRLIRRALRLIAGAESDRFGSHAMRIAIAIVFLWIGALKFAPYEADSITPFVANSPVMSFFYEHPRDYKVHLTHEGELKLQERAWQTANNTYGFSKGLGSLEIVIGLLTLSGLISGWAGLVGAMLAFFTPFVTLSFLFTTPEAWVPALGNAQHGFPYLSGAGRLVIKDVTILAGAWLVMVDSARAILARRAEYPILGKWLVRGSPCGLPRSHRKLGAGVASIFASAPRPPPERLPSASWSRNPCFVGGGVR